MNILLIFDFIEANEILCILDIEDIISLYLTCNAIKNILEREVPRLVNMYDLFTSVNNFSQMISTFYTLKLGKWTHKYIGINNTLARAPENGDIQMVQLLISKGALDFTKRAVIAAARYGSLEIITLLGGLTNNFGYVMVEAAAFGHIDIVDTYIKMGTIGVLGALKVACRNRHRNIVDLLIHKTDYCNSCIEDAYIGDCPYITDSILSKSRGNYREEIISGIADSGQYKAIIELSDKDIELY
jgi:hypothetical protein